MCERGLTIDCPNWLSCEEFSSGFGQGAYLQWPCSEGCGSLASSKSLDKKPIQCIPQCTHGPLSRDDPAVHRAIWVADIIDCLGSELQQQEKLAIPAENLGTLVLVRVPGIWLALL